VKSIANVFVLTLNLLSVKYKCGNKRKPNFYVDSSYICHLDIGRQVIEMAARYTYHQQIHIDIQVQRSIPSKMVSFVNDKWSHDSQPLYHE
jgi:hypothetical protein